MNACVRVCVLACVCVCGVFSLLVCVCFVLFCHHFHFQSPAVSALSLTRLQLSGTNSLFLSAILPLSALLNLP